MAELNLCWGCMNEKNTDETGVCLNCGYNENAPHLPSYLAPGTLLKERYYVGKLLSYNGESAKYLGYDTITQTKVMIREYMPDTMCVREKDSPLVEVDPNHIAQYKTLMSEFVELNKVLSKMRTLNHIVAPLDMFGDNNTGYVIFSWFEGMTLTEYLRENAGELSWEDVKKLFPPVFTTLSLVHNEGLVHRGISPENILINEEGEIKITGFAVSDERTANTELAPEIYSGYAAPEQYNSSNWQGSWTDVYGISALLYRVLTGVAPTDALSRMSNDDLIEPAAVNDNIPKNVSKVIMNGMALNGELRIQTITELVTQLFEQPEYNSVRLSSSSTQTIVIPKQGEMPRKRPPAKKKKPIARHILFVIIMAVILGFGLFGLMIMFFEMDNEKNSGNVPSVSGITVTTSAASGTSGTADGETTEPSGQPEPAVTELTTLTRSDRLEYTTAAVNQTIYVMNNIIGKNYEIIRNSDTYSSLVFNPVYEYNDTVDKGLIFEQSLAENENYTDGTEITVKVSLGAKFVTIPDYVGLERKDYILKLDALGIKYEEKEFETSDVKEGYIVKTEKDAGEKIDVEIGEVLIVYVAKKPPETTTEVTEPEQVTTVETEPEIPDIIGEDVDIADIIITFYE